MTRFVDEYMPDEVPGFPCVSNPRWSTLIQQVDSGAERASSRWANPLHTYTLPRAIRYHETFEALHDHWMIMRGPAYTWPFRDPLDFASVGLELPNEPPVLSRTDQTIGTGDGVTRQFQLVKKYQRSGQSYTRPIYHPVVSSVLIGINGANPETISPSFEWSVDRNTGIVTFEQAPPLGSVITAGYYFDVEVRFDGDDAFEGIIHTYQVSGFADLTLVEVRPCNE